MNLNFESGSQAGVKGVGFYCTKFAFLAVFIAIFVLINIQTANTAELSELTKQQLQSQNDELRRVLRERKDEIYFYFNRDSEISENHKSNFRINHLGMSCVDLIRLLQSDKTIELPTPDFIASNRSEELEVIDYIKHNTNLDKIAKDKFAPSISYEGTLHARNNIMLPTIKDYLEGSLENIPLIDEGALIAIDNRQVWVIKFPHSEYFAIIMFRPDEKSEYSFFSFQVKEIVKSGFIFNSYLDSITKNNYDNLPKEIVTLGRFVRPNYHPLAKTTKSIIANVWPREINNYPKLYSGLFKLQDFVIIWHVKEESNIKIEKKYYETKGIDLLSKGLRPDYTLGFEIVTNIPQDLKATKKTNGCVFNFN